MRVIARAEVLPTDRRAHCKRTSGKAAFPDCGQPAQKIHDLSLRQLRIQPVRPPTEVPWLKLIEAQFGVLTHVRLTNTDDTNDARRGVAASTLVAATDTATSPNLHLPVNRIRTVRSFKLETTPVRSRRVPRRLFPRGRRHDCSAGTQEFDATAHPIGSHARIAGTDQFENSPALSSSSSVYRPRSTRILRIRCVSGLR